MIGDIIIIEEIHKKKATKIFFVLEKKYKRKMVITIGGISGTGKSECSLLLQKWFFEIHKIRAKIIHIDDYYKTNYHIRDIVRKQTGIIGKDEIDWCRLNKVIKDFKENRRWLKVQRIHKYLDDYEHTISPCHKIDCLVIDGIYANFLKKKDFGIYLEGTNEDTFEFRVKRGKEDPNDKFRKIVLEKERNCIVQSKQLSDLIIPFEVE